MRRGKSRARPRGVQRKYTVCKTLDARTHARECMRACVYLCFVIFFSDLLGIKNKEREKKETTGRCSAQTHATPQSTPSGSHTEARYQKQLARASIRWRTPLLSFTAAKNQQSVSPSERHNGHDRRTYLLLPAEPAYAVETAQRSHRRQIVPHKSKTSRTH